jgi:hypothetical protein
MLLLNINRGKMRNVVPMMDVAGIANFISRLSFPFNIYLEAATEKEISMPGKM